METTDSMDAPSRTKKKKNAEALQKIGVALVELPEKELKSLDIPGELKTAVLEAKAMTKHGSRRRQLQYIGSLMRNLDPEPIQMAVEHLSLDRAKAAHQFQKMEAWRDHLISSDSKEHTPKDFISAFPHTDRQRLGQLIRNAANARDEKKRTKASRTLFRYIREVMEDTGEPAH
ncbi:ribosome biogenesis factor YjgA [Desulfocicer vacuolatum]|nr:ribosome biogenesis factor YjgA [Desulfocicer vacuolatum]